LLEIGNERETQKKKLGKKCITERDPAWSNPKDKILQDLLQK